MGQAEEANATGDAIATELGAESCATAPHRAVRHGRGPGRCPVGRPSVAALQGAG